MFSPCRAEANPKADSGYWGWEGGGAQRGLGLSRNKQFKSEKSERKFGKLLIRIIIIIIKASIHMNLWFTCYLNRTKA